MSTALIEAARSQLGDLEAQGLMKREYEILTPQSAGIAVRAGAGQRDVLNLCANNYLGLADHPRLERAAQAAIESHGLGMASVRFICGTQDLHTRLEERLARFLGAEDAILFSSCFDANAGIFEALLGSEDAVVSDALNHASIIDGIRLCKAARHRYANNDMAALEDALKAAQDARHRLIVTDGVFSMDGIIADLPDICALAEQYDALVMVDDCHATGFLGPQGGGTPDHFGLVGKVHLLSGTFGKALGGASGGYIAGPKPLIDLLRQRARPYLFSNALAPAIVAATLECLDMIAEPQGAERRDRLKANAARFRGEMMAAGFTLAGAGHPIVPVMLGEAPLAQRFAAGLMAEGIYATAFFYPVVPKGAARIRTQLSAAHSNADLDRAIAAFTKVGRELAVIP
ncbi:MAG: glycine C-acetyltransferase [Pseudomonadota bacterium]